MEGSLAFYIIYIPLLGLICFVGIALNGIMLMVLSVHSDTRTPQSILLKNMCTTDLLYLLGGAALILIVALLHHEIMCYITIFFVSFVMALNVYLVAALGLQRYISLKKFSNTPVVDERECKFSAWLAFGMWIVAIVLAGIEYALLRPVAETCVDSLLMGIPLYRLVLYAVVPVVIVTAFDISSSRLAAPLDAPREVIDRDMESKKMQFRLVLLCFLTYPPAIFITYVVGIHMNEEYRIMILPLGSILTTLNAFFRPIVMCMANRNLRWLFTSYFCCTCCCQEPVTLHQFNPVVKTTIQQTGDQTSESVL